MIQCMDTDNLHRRLAKVMGQIKAIDRMIDEDVPCEDILSQIKKSSVFILSLVSLYSRI